MILSCAVLDLFCANQQAGAGPGLSRSLYLSQHSTNDDVDSCLFIQATGHQCLELFLIHCTYGCLVGDVGPIIPHTHHRDSTG